MPDDPRQAPGSPTPTLLVLVGPPGVGKSTLARQLREAVGADIVQTDALRKALVARPTYRPAESAWVHRVAQQRLQQKLSRGLNVIFDATNLRKAHRRVLRNLAAVVGARLLEVVVWAPEDVVRARLQRRHDSPDATDRSDADWSVYQHLIATFEPLDSHHVVVNSTVELGPALDLIGSLVASIHPIL